MWRCQLILKFKNCHKISDDDYPGSEPSLLRFVYKNPRKDCVVRTLLNFMKKMNPFFLFYFVRKQTSKQTNSMGNNCDKRYWC